MKYYLLTLLFFFFLSACAEDLEVKHADTLQVIDKVINVDGNVLIHYEGSEISAKTGKIVKDDATGELSKAILNGDVVVKSPDKSISADKITFYISSMSLIAEGNTVSKILDEDSKEITTVADFQELRWDGKNSNAKGSIKTLYEETTILSDELVVIYKEGSPKEIIFYGINKYASLEQPTSSVKSKSVIFDINNDVIHCSGNVDSMTWPDEGIPRIEQDFVDLKADDLYIYNKNKEIKAKGSKNKVFANYQETAGQSQEALLVRDQETNKPEKIYFIGNAEVSQNDKNLLSQEVIFDFPTKKLYSSTKTNIRPKTIILKE